MELSDTFCSQQQGRQSGSEMRVWPSRCSHGAQRSCSIPHSIVHELEIVQLAPQADAECTRHSWPRRCAGCWWTRSDWRTGWRGVRGELGKRSGCCEDASVSAHLAQRGRALAHQPQPPEDRDDRQKQGGWADHRCANSGPLADQTHEVRHDSGAKPAAAD